MFDQYIQQLASQDVAERRQAIIALGNAGNPQALPTLANVYRTDPDPALRELALKAGRYIKGLTLTAPGVQPAAASAASAPPASTTSPFTVPTPAAPPASTVALIPAEPRAVTPFVPIASADPIKSLELLNPLPPLAPTILPGQLSAPKEISEYHQRLAQSRLDSAIGMVSHGENEKGLAELMAAIRYNPAIAKNTLAMNLAATITGIHSPDAAMQDILRRMNQAGGTVKRPGQPIDLKAMLAGTELLETVLMVALLFLITCGLGFGLKFMAQNLTEVMSRLTPGSRMASNEAALAASAAVTPPEILSRGALLTFGALIDTIVLYVLGLFLGGAGSLFRFLKAFLRIQIVIYLLLAVAFGLMVYGVNALAARQTEIGLTVFIIALVILLLTFLGGFIWQLLAMMRQHEVGFLTALLIVIVGLVAIGIVNAFIP